MRAEAVPIVNKLQAESPLTYIDDFLEFHMITREQFDETVEKFRNRSIWEIVGNDWQLKHKLE